MIRKIGFYGASVFLSLFLLLLLVLRVQWGGGASYPDLSSTPLFDTSALEVVYASPEPPGNVTVSASGRIFMTIHPESRTNGPLVMEIVDGRASPYPNAEFQKKYQTPLGVFIDTRDRLWILDHGNHGFQRPQLFAFDLSADTLAFHYLFTRAEAPAGSYLNDLQVAAEKEVVLISDLSVMRQHPALVVLDKTLGQARRVLERDSTTGAQKWTIPALTLPGRLASLRLGVDGLALDQAEEWLYYGAVCHEALYRVRLSDLLDNALPPDDLRERVQWVGKKPLSDGLSIDQESQVILTDVEHHGLMRLGRDGILQTLVAAPGKIRWADGCSYGPDNYLYFTDSALPDVMLHSRKHIRKKSPYFLYRIKMDFPGIPGR
ncbi:MAG: hypothetical protein IPL49_09405 [Saprospirales bacterium]|nr:hypothetical protein [Saprospirales bacterium]MBK8491086.1 hypothetical protein [Saprospirales bacterium]